MDLLWSAESLKMFGCDVFEAMGADEEVAREVAEHLVRSNLAGHDSHGILRVTEYIAAMDRGDLVPSARPVILTETTGVAVVDAQRGFGQYSTKYALEWCLRSAETMGIAGAAIRHSTHLGRLGDYTAAAADQGMIAFVLIGMSGTGVGSVAPFGGTGRFLGTNPWSIGIPVADDGIAIVCDFATSTVAEGKVRVARARGEQAPIGTVLDADGHASTEPGAFYAGGSLVPLGGALAGHKGYAMSLVAALVGSLGMIDDPNPSTAGGNAKAADLAAGAFVMVLNPGHFGSPASYRELVSRSVRSIKLVRPAPGRSEVLVPGEPEARATTTRSAKGIAVPQQTHSELTEAAARFGVQFPAAIRPGE